MKNEIIAYPLVKLNEKLIYSFRGKKYVVHAARDHVGCGREMPPFNMRYWVRFT